MKNTINLIVTDKEKGQRIDSFITYKQISLSRTRVKRLILNKKLKLNNSILNNPSIFKYPFPNLFLLIPFIISSF